MLRPLGLPPGSVRALLLLALTARVILDLLDSGKIAPWLGATLGLAAVAYFAFRASAPRREPPGEGDRVRSPLGLPGGTIRILFILALGVAAWLYLRDRDLGARGVAVVWVVGGFMLGSLFRWVLLLKARPADVGTYWIYHVQSLVVLMAAAALVYLAATGRADEVPRWVQPLLGAGCAWYFGAR